MRLTAKAPPEPPQSHAFARAGAGFRRYGLAALAWAFAAHGAGAQTPLLHVPSPDWRDQVIYFVMTDRFADGDPSNNNQGAGEYAPGQRSRYQGGDLRGLQQHLPYIQGLGATGLWITPPVANQWLNPSGDYAGYHGYWAENFMQVDKHLGTLADYQALSGALHSRGMVLVQDIVLNHTGNFFSYRDRWQRGDPVHGWEAHDQTAPVPRPSQPPFDQNDPRDPAQRKAGVYHWTPDVRDYNDPFEEHHFQMSGLDDLNTGNPTVRRALRQSYGHWIQQVGVDAFRVDTAFYMPAADVEDFLNAQDSQAPGVRRVAAATGRKQFLVFGEGFGIDKPGQDKQARKIEGYVTGSNGQPVMDGMLNFPLYGALQAVFARGAPSAELGDRIQRVMALHRSPHLMPSFVDNHDVDRFLAGGDTAGLRQALLALFTLPGIPVVYYGTEQGFKAQRASMFAAGWGSGGRDYFDTQAPLYRDIAAMAQLRREHRVLSRGVPTVRHANTAQPGALAWTMAAAGQAAQMLVVFNTAGHPSLLDHLDTGLPAGTQLQGVYGLDGRPADLRVDRKGHITLPLQARGGWVWRVVDTTALHNPSAPASVNSVPASPMAPILQALPDEQVTGDFDITGQAEPGTRLMVLLDGDLAHPVHTAANPQGQWRARIDTADLVDPTVTHTLVVWDPALQRSSQRQPFRVDRPWVLVADVADPAGDDTGPGAGFGAGIGPYTYPTDPGWGARRQMDLRRVQVHTAGGALRLTLQTQHISRLWNPDNGFDHVAFTLFIQLPGQPEPGQTVMPLQDGVLPEGLRWHRRLRAHGWSNALFSSVGATAQHEGTVVTPAAHLAVDAAQHQVTFTLPAAALGRLQNLSGARVWVTTWDYDGGYRALGPTAQAYGMGGGRPGQPKVMDSSDIITLP